MTTPPGVSVGAVIAEKYRVERVLGAGGMGVVVAARHLRLDQEVAIKFLAQDMLKEPTAVSRFEREARAAAKLKSAHVVRVFDVGSLPSGVPYMVMEQLHGSDLSSRLQLSGNLALEDAADFVIQACFALGEAHGLGIIHRDIKPSNLFCVDQPGQRVLVKVLDFGISKMTLASTAFDGSITATATAIGSPNYMSPEQMRSASRVDARTDIWSLGIVLYELVTGCLPFRAETYPELCLRIAGDPPAPPRTYRADLPESFQSVILRCLAKDPAQRFANVEELARALLPFAPAHTRANLEPRTRDNVGRDARSSSSAPPSEPAKARFAWGRSSTRARSAATQLGTSNGDSKRASSLLAAGGLLVALGGLVAAGVWVQRRGASEEPLGVSSAPLPEPVPTPHAAVPAAQPVEPPASANAPLVIPVAPPASPSAVTSVRALPPASSHPSATPAPPRGSAAQPAAASRPTKTERRAKSPIWTQRE